MVKLISYGRLAVVFCVLWSTVICLSAETTADRDNLFMNGDFKQRAAGAPGPSGYELAGDVKYRYLGDANRDVAGWGVALLAGKDLNRDGARAGEVSQTVAGIDAKAGRWFRFGFRGLAQDAFVVGGENLYMKVEYFGGGGKTSYDGKLKKIYPLVELDRRNMTVNGDRHVGGAAVWRTYELEFRLPFDQVDQLRLSVGFGNGLAKEADGAEFYVTDFRLERMDRRELLTNRAPPGGEEAQPAGVMPIGGRWFYLPKKGETQMPKMFDYTNSDRLLYHDDRCGAPFAGNMTSWLRAGDKDMAGNIVTVDQPVLDNVTINFDATSMVVHTKGLPNHPTGKFPEAGFGPQSNPNYIQEHQNTYYIPVNPQVNAGHIVTARDNSNHALPMGPIGVAMNGVVFFNPFDAGNQDATSMMDRCCGHPAPDNTYHYHKYPICINSPWADDGAEHSPVIGWAFDGFPIYGPYEKAGVMAKDVAGAGALNDFNLHWDAERGWHYHVTPGKFPYIIGGYWGTEDPRDKQRGRPPGGGPNGRMGPPPGGFGGRQPPPPDGGPPPGG